MIRIALTGGTCTGKSTAVGFFVARGVPCLIGDELVHRLYAENDSLRSELRAAFGDGVVDDNGVNRKALADIVFGDTRLLAALNSVVHKYVRASCLEWLMSLEDKGEFAAVFEAPQLFEAGMQDEFDIIVTVSADRGECAKRFCVRNNAGSDAAEKVMKNQLSDDEYVARADYVIYNRSLGELERSVGEFIGGLKSGIIKPRGRMRDEC